MIECEFCKRVSTDEDRDKPDRVIRTYIDVEYNCIGIFNRAFALCGACRDALAVHFADAVQTTRETRKEAVRGTSP